MGLQEKIAERVETKTRKSERTRERIVEAAWELVLERRSADFQMAEVAAACGMTKGAPYYYFPDRTALVEEVFDRAAGEFLERIEELAAQNLPSQEILEALCKAFAEEVLQGGVVIVALATELAGTTGALSRLESRVDRISGIVEEQLIRARLGARFVCDLRSVSLRGVPTRSRAGQRLRCAGFLGRAHAFGDTGACKRRVGSQQNTRVFRSNLQLLYRVGQRVTCPHRPAECGGRRPAPRRWAPPVRSSCCRRACREPRPW